tara:strand:- start:4708 stop:4824 length:117 start_codon:yes stop_codon:yes gene_type:complete
MALSQMFVFNCYTSDHLEALSDRYKPADDVITGHITGN